MRRRGAGTFSTSRTLSGAKRCAVSSCAVPVTSRWDGVPRFSPTVAAAPPRPASASCWQSVAGVSLPPVRKKVVPPARQAATGSQAQPWAETSRQSCHGRPSAAANNCTLETPGSTVYGSPAASNARESAAAPE